MNNQSNRNSGGGVTKRKKPSKSIRTEAPDKPNSSQEGEDEGEEEEEEEEAGTSSQIEAKKQKRQEANRQSALLSKARKAHHEQSLNLRLSSLQEESRGLDLRVGLLREDEMKLRRYLAALSTHHDYYRDKLREALELKRALEGSITSLQEQQGLERRLPRGAEEAFPPGQPSSLTGADCPLPPPPFLSRGYGNLQNSNMMRMVPGHAPGLGMGMGIEMGMGVGMGVGMEMGMGMGMGMGVGSSWVPPSLPLPLPLPLDLPPALPLSNFPNLQPAPLIPTTSTSIIQHAPTLFSQPQQAALHSSHGPFAPSLSLPLAMLSLTEPHSSVLPTGQGPPLLPPQPLSGGPPQRGSMKPGLLSLSLTSQLQQASSSRSPAGASNTPTGDSLGK